MIFYAGQWWYEAGDNSAADIGDSRSRGPAQDKPAPEPAGPPKKPSGSAPKSTAPMPAKPAKPGSTPQPPPPQVTVAGPGGTPAPVKPPIPQLGPAGARNSPPPPTSGYPQDPIPWTREDASPDVPIPGPPRPDVSAHTAAPIRWAPGLGPADVYPMHPANRVFGDDTLPLGVDAFQWDPSKPSGGVPLWPKAGRWDGAPLRQLTAADLADAPGNRPGDPGVPPPKWTPPRGADEIHAAARAIKDAPVDVAVGKAAVSAAYKLPVAQQWDVVTVMLERLTDTNRSPALTAAYHAARKAAESGAGSPLRAAFAVLLQAFPKGTPEFRTLSRVAAQACGAQPRAAAGYSAYDAAGMVEYEMDCDYADDAQIADDTPDPRAGDYDPPAYEPPAYAPGRGPYDISPEPGPWETPRGLFGVLGRMAGKYSEDGDAQPAEGDTETPSHDPDPPRSKGPGQDAPRKPRFEPVPDYHPDDQYEPSGVRVHHEPPDPGWDPGVPRNTVGNPTNPGPIPAATIVPQAQWAQDTHPSELDAMRRAAIADPFDATTRGVLADKLSESGMGREAGFTRLNALVTQDVLNSGAWEHPAYVPHEQSRHWPNWSAAAVRDLPPQAQTAFAAGVIRDAAGRLFGPAGLPPEAAAALRAADLYAAGLIPAEAAAHAASRAAAVSRAAGDDGNHVAHWLGAAAADVANPDPRWAAGRVERALGLLQEAARTGIHDYGAHANMPAAVRTMAEDFAKKWKAGAAADPDFSVAHDKRQVPDPPAPPRRRFLGMFASPRRPVFYGGRWFYAEDDGTFSIADMGEDDSPQSAETVSPDPDPPRAKPTSKSASKPTSQLGGPRVHRAPKPDTSSPPEFAPHDPGQYPDAHAVEPDSPQAPDEFAPWGDTGSQLQSAAHQGDDTAKLAYADYLDETGKPAEATAVRVGVATADAFRKPAARMDTGSFDYDNPASEIRALSPAGVAAVKAGLVLAGLRESRLPDDVRAYLLNRAEQLAAAVSSISVDEQQAVSMTVYKEMLRDMRAHPGWDRYIDAAWYAAEIDSSPVTLYLPVQYWTYNSAVAPDPYTPESLNARFGEAVRAAHAVEHARAGEYARYAAPSDSDARQKPVGPTIQTRLPTRRQIGKPPPASANPWWERESAQERPGAGSGAPGGNTSAPEVGPAVDFARYGVIETHDPVGSAWDTRPKPVPGLPKPGHPKHYDVSPTQDPPAASWDTPPVPVPGLPMPHAQPAFAGFSTGPWGTASASSSAGQPDMVEQCKKWSQALEECAPCSPSKYGGTSVPGDWQSGGYEPVAAPPHMQPPTVFVPQSYFAH